MLEACTRAVIAFLAWFPPARTLSAQPTSALARAAERHAATPEQVALAWLLAHSPVCVPLPGTVDPVQPELDLSALDIELTTVEIDRLTA